MAAVPIWKDFFAEVSGVYRIYLVDTGSVIYSGHAVARPGEAYGRVRINDVCADYLVNSLPTLTDRAYTALSAPTFKVQMLVPGAQGSQWVDLYTKQFVNDWSYDYGGTPADLSCPINGRVDDRMVILFSGNGMTSLSASYHRTAGTSTSRSVTLPSTPAIGTGAFKANAVSGVDRITIKSRVYYPVGSCYRYALYYVNAYGGWDQFLIEGNDLEADGLTRFVREVEYDNSVLVNRGSDNYVSEIRKTWTLHSGLLTDDQASRMHHLVNSQMVYLCHIASGDMIPVVMRTDNCEYKTYKNQGRRMVEYTLEVELAQNRIRR